MDLMLALLAVSVLGIAPASTGAQSPLQLSLRVHLMEGGPGRKLTTVHDSASVAVLVRTANAIWAEAGIEWKIEAVVRREAPRAASYDSLLRVEIPMTREPFAAYFPGTDLLEPGWNLHLFGDFGTFGGGMFVPELRGVILAERGMGVPLPPEGRGGATLAHELGHALGLDHVPCDASRNIMAVGCWRPDGRSTLTEAQRLAARAQAATGSPPR